MKRILKNKHSISLSPRTEEMIDKYAERFGQSNLSSAIEFIVGHSFVSDFPAYVFEKPLTDKQMLLKQREEREKMSNEEYLLQVIKGKVFAGKAWIVSTKGTWISFPVDDAKLFDSQDDPLIARHKAIIDGTYVDIDGLTGSEMQKHTLRFWDEKVPVLKVDANGNPIYADEKGEMPKQEVPQAVLDEDAEIAAMMQEIRPDAVVPTEDREEEAQDDI